MAAAAPLVDELRRSLRAAFNISAMRLPASRLSRIRNAAEMFFRRGPWTSSTSGRRGGASRQERSWFPCPLMTVVTPSSFENIFRWTRKPVSFLCSRQGVEPAGAANVFNWAQHGRRKSAPEYAEKCFCDWIDLLNAMELCPFLDKPQRCN